MSSETKDKLVEIKDQESDLPKKELYSNTQKIFAEFIGTFLLVFLSCGGGIFSKCDLTLGCLAGGATILLVAYCIGKISGCHINPACTINLHIRGEINFILAVSYIVAQCTGSLSAAFLLGLIKGDFTDVGSTKLGKILYYEKPSLSARSYLMGIVCEIIYTAILLFVIFASGDKNFPYQDKGPFMIATYIIAGASAAGSLTGFSMNPARSLGPAIVEFLAGKSEALSQIWIYIIGPIIGAILGTNIYKMIS